MKFARIENGVAVEIVDLADEATLAERYHPDLAATFRSAPDYVAHGWVVEGDSLAPPPEPEPDFEALWAALRRERNRRLTLSDWTQIADASLDQTSRDAWAAYRQALRDLPEQTEDPRQVAWPAPPA